MRGARIDGKALDMLAPMHLVFDAMGRVRHAGPTLSKMAGDMNGKRLSDAVRFRRPRLVGGPDEVLEQVGRRLMVELPSPEEGAEPVRLRATVAPLPQGGGILQFAFGPDIMDAVGRHGLSAQDFSPVDTVIEILFLMESQALIRAELSALAERLDAARREAEEEAATDNLTKLRNRRAMDKRLGRLCETRAASFGVMQLDLDHFKEVNDTLGHAAGDVVLEEVAQILREETRGGDFLARVGGDEFVLIFEDGVMPERLDSIAERILARLAEPFEYDGRSSTISGSIGIALSTDYAMPTPERIMADADAALYEAKRSGRSRHSMHRPDDAGPDRRRRSVDATGSAA